MTDAAEDEACRNVRARAVSREAILRLAACAARPVLAAVSGSIIPRRHSCMTSAGRCPSPRPWIFTGDGGAYIKPLLIQAAWAAVRVPGRLQARFGRLVRTFGGPRNKGAQKRAITAIARTLLKIACNVLKTGAPYADLGTDSCTRRESSDARQDYLIRQLQKLNPGSVITITPAEAA